jgi:hypothetical protein
MTEHGDRERAAGQKNEARNFSGFDDVAGFTRLFQVLLCWLFRSLGGVVIVCHGLSPAAHRKNAIELA